MKYEYKYKITNINEEERLITIASSNRSYMEEPNSFVHLVKMIQNDVNGSIENVGEIKFKISNADLELVYMWDGLFGISVQYPENVSKDDVVNFLNKYMSDF